MKISICATGDSIMMNPPPKEYKGLERLKNIIDKADIRINNLEMVLSNYNCFASTFCGGTWLTSPPEILEELLAYGFNYFSIANNHTMDYSYSGIKSTLTTLKKHEVAFSGAGNDLAEASKPAFIEAQKSKVGLISICATNDDAARAGYARPPIPGRPGLNPLRHSEVYSVSSFHMNALKEIAKNTFINGRIDNSKKGGYTVQKPGLFSLGTIDFKESDMEGKTSSCNKHDMVRTKKAIENALKEAEYLVVLVHSHEIKGLTDDEPDYFLEEFARACIDWGASAVIGSG
ncbi:MAG: CapA family protein, partial [Spirochaetia bacterium]|nr:CapA family protein [Spirochaetia bacterium]